VATGFRFAFKVAEEITAPGSLDIPVIDRELVNQNRYSWIGRLSGLSSLLHSKLMLPLLQ
jgi:hypothetical protein